MSIRTNIEGVMQEIAAGNFSLGEEIRQKAIAAIMAGQGSPAWAAYMDLFSQTPEQLARLIPTDDTGNDPNMNRARTYLVANGMCGSDTTGSRTTETVGDTLDENLP